MAADRQGAEAGGPLFPQGFRTRLKYLLNSIGNIHCQGPRKNIYLFSTPRSGSTWVMEILSSVRGMKFYDEPFNIRRANVRKTRVISDWDVLMPGNGGDETLLRFLKRLEANRYRHMNPTPLRRNHNFFTRRIVFKIHEVEHLINVISKRLNGQVVYLLRHPIPNTLSRHVFPRLPYFMHSPYFRERVLSAEQVRMAEKIYARGSILEQGVLSWCFQHLIPLNFLDRRGWFVMTYEELLLNPEKMCVCLNDRLQLDALQSLLDSVNRPAVNIAMSEKQTLEILGDSDVKRRRRKLVTKWKARVSEADEGRVFEILKAFDIDAYTRGRFIADRRYLLFEDTELAEVAN